MHDCLKILASHLVSQLHDNNVYVVASNHDFNATPKCDDIKNRLIYMQENGADILKVAVMPTCEEDVLTLMSAVIKYRQEYGQRPVIAMSMGGQGVISRLVGEFLGSAVTFASAGKTSAPGQMPVEKVRNILEVIHMYN